MMQACGVLLGVARRWSAVCCCRHVGRIEMFLVREQLTPNIHTGASLVLFFFCDGLSIGECFVGNAQHTLAIRFYEDVGYTYIDIRFVSVIL